MSGDGPAVDLANPSCPTADSSGRGPAAAQSRVVTMLRETVLELDSLPASLCPADEAVLSFWFCDGTRCRQGLLQAMSRLVPIRVVGSRSPKPRATGTSQRIAEWFVAGGRASFRRLLESMEAWRPSRRRAALFDAVARIALPTPDERLRVRWEGERKTALEVVLHATDGTEDRHIVEGFRGYLQGLGLQPHRDRVLFTGGLAFLGLKADAGEVFDVARFAFVRLVREMPRLRLQRVDNDHGTQVHDVYQPAEAHAADSASHYPRLSDGGAHRFLQR